jgi:hypothetical protein
MITTDIYFPEDLPCPLLSGNQTNHVQPFLRTGMESGRARQRRTFTSVPSISQYSWIFTSNQAAAFEIWFKEVALDGAAWFNIHRPTPLGDSILVCRFTRMYQGPNSLGKGLWSVTAELEAWERPLLPDGWGLLPDFVIYSSIFDLAMNREWPEA